MLPAVWCTTAPTSASATSGAQAWAGAPHSARVMTRGGCAAAAAVRTTPSPSTDRAWWDEGPAAGSTLGARTADPTAGPRAGPAISADPTSASRSPAGPPCAEAAKASWTASASPTASGSVPPRVACAASGDPASGATSETSSGTQLVQAPSTRERTSTRSPSTSASCGHVRPTVWNPSAGTTSLSTRSVPTGRSATTVPSVPGAGAPASAPASACGARRASRARTSPSAVTGGTTTSSSSTDTSGGTVPPAAATDPDDPDPVAATGAGGAAAGGSPTDPSATDRARASAGASFMKDPVRCLGSEGRRRRGARASSERRSGQSAGPVGKRAAVVVVMVVVLVGVPPRVR